MTTKLQIFIICALITLISGCSNADNYDAETKVKTEASLAVISENLPKSCEFKYLGNYITPNRETIRTVAVFCSSSSSSFSTTTLSSSRLHGKGQSENIVTVNVTPNKNLSDIDTSINNLKDQRTKIEQALAKLSSDDRKALGIK